MHTTLHDYRIARLNREIESQRGTKKSANRAPFADERNPLDMTRKDLMASLKKHKR